MKLDLAEIPSEVVRSMLLDVIEEQLKTKHFQIKLNSATKEGDHNFTGIIYRISSECDDKEGNGITTTSTIILKIAPQNLARRTQFNCRPAFSREIYTYDKIFPVFRDFERSKGVDIETNSFREYPKCFRTIGSELNECLILEDLCARGFFTIDRQTSTITANHVRLVMQGLAKFHAISFALKDQQPNKFNELTSNLSEVFIMRSNTPLRFALNYQTKLVFNAVTGANDAHLLAKMTEFYKNEAIDTAVDCIDLEATGSASVITYGDVWQNNILFKYDSNGEPIETSFVDWQAVRHASPVIDIAFFIFCCTTKEVRDIHYNDFIRTYHETLSMHIQRLGSDPVKLFPYEQMLEHLRKFAKYGLILATVILPVITSEREFGLDFDKFAKGIEDGSLQKNEKHMKDAFVTERSLMNLNKRLRDVIADMVHLNYI